MTVIVGRSINGISINKLEYLLNDKGDPMQFKDEEAARKFLRDNHFSETEINSFIYEVEGEE